MNEIQLTDSQQLAYDYLTQTNQNIFVTGGPGSGKSFLIRYYLKKNFKKTLSVLASTGAAAVLIGGRTFHSFMGLGILQGGVDKTISRALKNKRLIRRLQKVETVVVDEISMLSGRDFAVAETICRMVRRNESPWGGIRMIVIGDFFQLPPVSRGGPKDWIFQNDSWQNTKFQTVYLDKNIRTTDDHFLKVLNEIRFGKINDSVTTFLNEHVIQHEEGFDYQNYTYLLPRRNEVERINQRELAMLEGDLIQISTEYDGEAMAIEKLKNYAPIPEILNIKKHAYVMIRFNDPKMRFVNGTCGFVREIFDDVMLIELVSGRMIELNKVSFSLLNDEGDVVAVAKNFPVVLAYAITIHKSQGATLEKIVVDLGGLWEPGQAYVALSRLVSAKGLKILRWTPKSIFTDPQVENFYNSQFNS